MVSSSIKPTVINQVLGPDYALYHGDSCEVIKGIPDNSVHYSIFSPPFASLYTYSASERDMGNSRTKSEFYNHFQFLVGELYRVLAPGRLLSFHCMNMQTLLQRDGYVGIDDFRGDLIRMFQAAGFIYHSEVVIWKDPVVAMQRTKAIGLLHCQVVKDSCRSRQGIPDYLVTMLKPGVNPQPVSGRFDTYYGEERVPPTGDYSIEVWQRYASPVWMDINPSDTLQGEKGKKRARDSKDERHIAPLQLDVIRRGIQLWSNPGDIVLSPFGGIGSEPYVSIEMGRKAIAIELKESYFGEMASNVKAIAGTDAKQTTLFDLSAMQSIQPVAV